MLDYEIGTYGKTINRQRCCGVRTTYFLPVCCQDTFLVCLFPTVVMLPNLFGLIDHSLAPNPQCHHTIFVIRE